MTTIVPEPRRLLSGITGLDTMLSGGFMLGGLYIVQGAPGTGKTILANQLCFHHVARGGRAMFVTLLAENHARMIANLAQFSFFDEMRIGQKLTYLSGFNEMHQGGLSS
jgi:circadian clock protein KaiC